VTAYCVAYLSVSLPFLLCKILEVSLSLTLNFTISTSVLYLESVGIRQSAIGKSTDFDKVGILEATFHSRFRGQANSRACGNMK
jgi:hypothetical protein